MTLRLPTLVLCLAALGACDKGTRPPRHEAGEPGDAGAKTGGLLTGTLDGTWREFAVPDEPLALSLPGVPKENRWTWSSGGASVAESTWVVMSADGALGFTVGVARFPPGMMPADYPIDELLDKETMHFLALEPQEIGTIHKRRLDAGDMPGMDATVETRTGLEIHQRVYHGKDRSYALSASTRVGEASRAEDIERFFGSVRFTPPR
jgi:hypothetical protein